jgi:transmembrane sensor
MESQVYFKVIQNIVSEGIEYAGEINEWLNESDENKKVYQDLLKVWQLTGSFPKWFNPDREKAWKNIQGYIHSSKRKNAFLYRRISQIAASIIIIITSIWFGSKLDNRNRESQYTVIYSPTAQKTRIVLPDSSIVLLNGNSEIRYNQNFNEFNRRVELKGEGYFEVRKNLLKRFIVSAEGIEIKVFGTVFNVKAYNDDRSVEVGLINGRVSIDRDKNEIVKLTPGQIAVFDKKDQKLNVKKAAIDLVSAWTREEMIFEENSIKEIAKYIERWYNVEVHIAPELLSDNELLTFKVKTESLNELLSLINLLKPIKYRIDGKQVYITKP